MRLKATYVIVIGLCLGTLLLTVNFGNSALLTAKNVAFECDEAENEVLSRDGYHKDSVLVRLRADNRDLLNKIDALHNELDLLSKKNLGSSAIVDEISNPETLDPKQANAFITNALEARDAVHSLAKQYENGENRSFNEVLRIAFDKEPRVDSNWKLEYEDALFDLFTQDGTFKDFGVYGIECRVTTCYMQLAANSIDEANSIVTKLQRNISNDKYPGIHSVKMAFDPNSKTLDLYVEPSDKH